MYLYTSYSSFYKLSISSTHSSYILRAYLTINGLYFPKGHKRICLCYAYNKCLVGDTELHLVGDTELHLIGDTELHLVDDTELHLVGDTELHLVGDTELHLVGDTELHLIGDT